MGQVETNGIKPIEKISINHFEFKYIIGRGGFGKVWKVVCKKNGKEYAMKVMSKVKIIDRKSQKSIISERHILSKLCNPFIVNMVYSFQDQDQLYLVMDLLTGGDLRYHISRLRIFTQERTKFFLACLILGLEYIHDNFVIHRDIKPENLVCDSKGYIRITDFGVAKKYRRDNGNETSGTPGYMAPEVLCAQNHSYPVDYFALGVIGFEFMLGKRPYRGKSRKEIKQDVLGKQVQINPNDNPQDWSNDAVSFINLLIQRKPNQRLGYNGISEIRSHPWFKDYPWNSIMQKVYESPFKPGQGDNFDKHYCDGEDKLGNETQERYCQYKKSDSYETVFNKYTYDNISQEEYQNYYNSTRRNSNNLSIGSSNSTLASVKRTSSTNSMKDLCNINLIAMGKLKLKPDNFSSSSSINKTKTPLNNIGINGHFQKNQMLKMKASFLTPSALMYSNYNDSFYFGEKNLPMIQSSIIAKKPIKKSSSSSHFIFNGKNATVRPQTILNNKENNNALYIINGPMNVKQVSFSNHLMGTTMGGFIGGDRQIKRNKSTAFLNNKLNPNKS